MVSAPVEAPEREPEVAPPPEVAPVRRMDPDTICEPQKHEVVRKVKEVFE